MDLDKIKAIVNTSGLSSKDKQQAIYEVLAQDVDAIPQMLKILNLEREQKHDLIVDMNLELSRAHLYVEAVEVKKEPKIGNVNRPFIMDSIAAFYIKYKGKVSHCFNRFN